MTIIVYILVHIHRAYYKTVITDQKNLLVELGATPKVFTGNSRVVKQRGTYHLA